MGWDGTEWVEVDMMGLGWDGIRQNGMGWDEMSMIRLGRHGIGWKRMGWDEMDMIRMRMGWGGVVWDGIG